MQSRPVRKLGLRIESYTNYQLCHSDRRAQYLVAGSTVVSASDQSESLDDEEACISPIEERVDEELDEDVDDQSRIPHHDFIGQFEWDDDMEPESSEHLKAAVPKLFISPPPESPFLTPVAKTAEVHETTPLLRPAISFSLPPHDRRTSDPPPLIVKDSIGPLYDHVPSSAAPLSRRRFSGSSSKGVECSHGGQSTFGQTVNATLNLSFIDPPLIHNFSSSTP